MMCIFSCPRPGYTEALNFLHLGANSPCLECLQLPGEEVHNFILIFWSSRMQLPSFCSPRVWPALQQGEEITMGTDMQTVRPKMVVILLNTDELMQRPPSFQCNQALWKNNIYFARCVTRSLLHLLGLSIFSVVKQTPILHKSWSFFRECHPKRDVRKCYCNHTNISEDVVLS